MADQNIELWFGILTTKGKYEFVTSQNSTLGITYDSGTTTSYTRYIVGIQVTPTNNKGGNAKSERARTRIYNGAIRISKSDMERAQRQFENICYSFRKTCPLSTDKAQYWILMI